MAGLKRPERISDTLSGALMRAGLGRISVVGELGRKWRVIVGEGMAKHSRPIMLKSGSLTLVVDSPAWMNEISLLTPTVIEKINAVTGDGTVTDIRLRQGGKRDMEEAGAVTQQAGASKAKPPKRKPTPAELAEIDEAVEPIEDPEVREAAKRMLIAACTSGA